MNVNEYKLCEFCTISLTIGYLGHLTLLTDFRVLEMKEIFHKSMFSSIIEREIIQQERNFVLRYNESFRLYEQSILREKDV